MCGIVVLVYRRTDRPVPSADQLLPGLAGLSSQLRDAAAAPGDGGGLLGVTRAAGTAAGAADHLLGGIPGVRALLEQPGLAEAIEERCAEITACFQAVEVAIDEAGAGWPAGRVEEVNAALVDLRDATWALQHDRLRTAAAVAELAGVGASLRAVEGYTAIQQTLAGIDRLEVRGRDSAGIEVFVTGHGLDLESSTVAPLLRQRPSDPLFRNGSVHVVDGGGLSFVYKAAAEIGELGDNTAAMRSTIAADRLLRLAMSGDGANVRVLAHTRWASVGIISEPNAHPLNSEEIGVADGPYVVAALNGDIDNFADLKAAERLEIASDITTDAKVIPTVVSRGLAKGEAPIEAFRHAVQTFEGSVAIAAATAADPGRVLLALRGSGQALYVGLSDDLYIVASEPYGVVELADTYLRLDGETPSNPDAPAASRGQIVALDRDQAGTLEGIGRWSYDGTPLPVTDADLVRAEITTRDVDRGSARHFLLKEITEAPASFRKTLRGKLLDGPDGLRVSAGPTTLPESVEAALRSGRIDRVVAVGQGTAAIAAEAVALALGDVLSGTDVRVEATLATELSGFRLRLDMSDTLVIAVSQSGTTTDTNRTVDLARARGAAVVSIVNRRDSDLTDKSDGVLYTSDGRDVEMSVASTKAFYSQVAAGFLLAGAIAQVILEGDARGDAAARRRALADQADVLTALRALPDALEQVLATRPAIAEAARRFAPPKRYWAIVGSGPDRIAAREIRIKLSELCYKAIACDTTEDKKHIDLSSEPLIFVCAAGLQGSTADDVAKEVAIYRAHKATPVVVATEGEDRFNGAHAVLTVPATHPRLGFVLATMVGHLFGYEAALAIDASARPLREARAAIEQAVIDHLAADQLLDLLRPQLAPAHQRFADGLRTGTYNGHLEASTAVRLASLLRYAGGLSPLESYQLEFGKQGTPSLVLEDLTAALTDAIDELTRPIDAIKHQAKTVTVGISRSDEGLLQVPLVAAVLDAGAGRDRLSYKALRALAALDPAVAEVRGFTRYAIDETDQATPTIEVVDRGGVSRDIPSRTAGNPLLRGTKRRAVTEREVTAAVGSDQRHLVLVPEVKGNQCTGLTLLQVQFHDRLAEPVIRGVMEGYRSRYGALRDAVTESEPVFRDDLLADQPVVELLTQPVLVLAKRWTEG
ncbi:MAG TPA: SIS domain-containing protein [Acidimicrobiales bacterium]|jgi:glucosamine--fructose-6-phosphate aminotransferase (isomerizing)|nr:SIS domain-containing protein [Acidimicrobiales bacterium]